MDEFILDEVRVCLHCDNPVESFTGSVEDVPPYLDDDYRPVDCVICKHCGMIDGPTKMSIFVNDSLDVE